MNPYDRLFELIVEQRLKEGVTSGRDYEATKGRLYKWFASRNPKAKPGQPGYMRGRNVPPPAPHPASQYDPERHKPPKKGKPLEYKHPQHADYARVGIGSLVGHPKPKNLIDLAGHSTEKKIGEPTDLSKRLSRVKGHRRR